MGQDGWQCVVSGGGPVFADLRPCEQDAGSEVNGEKVGSVEKEPSSWTEASELVSETKGKSAVLSRRTTSARP